MDGRPSMEPQLLRCGNRIAPPRYICPRPTFNGATTFALWKRQALEVILVQVQPSMEPQLLRCGNQITL